MNTELVVSSAIQNRVAKRVQCHHCLFPSVAPREPGHLPSNRLNQPSSWIEPEPLPGLRLTLETADDTNQKMDLLSSSDRSRKTGCKAFATTTRHLNNELAYIILSQPSRIDKKFDLARGGL